MKGVNIMDYQDWKDLEDLEDLAYKRFIEAGNTGGFTAYAEWLPAEYKEAYLRLKEKEMKGVNYD